MIRIILTSLTFLCSVQNIYAQSSAPLIITEIMPNPTPSRGLPDAEYVEIFNPSLESVLLSDFTFVYQNTRVPLPSVRLLPQQYAILVRASIVSLFDNFPIQVIPVSRLSLTNTGAHLRLIKTMTEELIHEVRYAPDWGDMYSKGGYALEMIDERYPCVEKSNWGSSISQVGGTPGKPNSIRAISPDLTPPTYVYYELTKETNGGVRLSLVMSEKLDAQNKGEIRCNFELDFNSVHVSQNRINASIIGEIPHSVAFTCQLTNWSDCSGNPMADTTCTIGFFREPKPGELVFSELLSNPFEKGEKFIEVVNLADEIVSLKNVSVSQKGTDGAWGRGDNVTTADIIMYPKSYKFLSKNSTTSTAMYPHGKRENGIEMARFPSMPQVGATLGLFNSEGQLLDEVVYSEKMHHPSLSNVKGVSLEKIHLKQGSMNITNWLSATTLAGYATPGTVNSQNALDITEDERKNTHKWKVKAPVFAKSNPSFPQKAMLEYTFDVPGTVAQIDVLRSDGSFFQRLHTSVLLGLSGEIEWVGGAQLETGHYFFHIVYFDASGGSDVELVKIVYVNE